MLFDTLIGVGLALINSMVVTGVICLYLKPHPLLIHYDQFGFELCPTLDAGLVSFLFTLFSPFKLGWKLEFPLHECGVENGNKDQRQDHSADHAADHR